MSELMRESEQWIARSFEYGDEKLRVTIVFAI
jgi:hypothetical protein